MRCEFYIFNNNEAGYWLKLVVLSAFLFLSSCSQKNIVEEHFQSHGISYPLDTSAMTAGNVEYVGIKDTELLEQGAREYVENGILSVNKYFENYDIHTLIPGAKAVVLNKPVLFRDTSGKVGLMVCVTVYGSGQPSSKIKLPIEWVGSDKKLWKVKNFAYFSSDESKQWHHNGWVY